VRALLERLEVPRARGRWLFLVGLGKEFVDCGLLRLASGRPLARLELAVQPGVDRLLLLTARQAQSSSSSASRGIVPGGPTVRRFWIFSRCSGCQASTIRNDLPSQRTVMSTPSFCFTYCAITSSLRTRIPLG